MIETPPIEGVFFCAHVARDSCDVIEIVMRKKKFHKITFSRITCKNRGDVRLLEYYSCEKCFVIVCNNAASRRLKFEKDNIKNTKDLFRSTGSRYLYKVVGNKHLYSERRNVYEECTWSYHAVRNAIGFTVGSGYEINPREVKRAWSEAHLRAYVDYYHMIHGKWPSKEERNKVLDEDWLKSQKPSIKLRLTRMAKANLAALDYAEYHIFRRFDNFLNIAGRRCVGCHVCLEKGVKGRCRFCQKPKKRNYAYVKKGVKRLITIHAKSESRREKRSEQFENDGVGSTIGDEIIDKGYGETMSDLTEDYGSSEAMKILKSAGAGKDELEDYYEDVDPCDRDEIERNSK